FHDGWLRTGDVGTLDARGYLAITDRAKDVIKSGGEWVSSVELENAIAAHEDVLEAAVIGIPDARWQERTLPCVVARAGASVDVEAVQQHLRARLASFRVPDAWAFVDRIPRTSVGKLDERALRKAFADGELRVVRTARAARQRDEGHATR